MKRLACIALLLGCETQSVAEDAFASTDVHISDAYMEPDAALAPCCVESHFASFPIPSTPGEGLPYEARYTVMLERVHDDITGLIWQLRTDGVRRSLDEAEAYCEALVLEGQGDFHLPTRIELITLLELARSPTIALALAPTEPEYHWSSSRYAARSTSAFSVYFGAGAVDLARGENRSALARCVARPDGESIAQGPTVQGAFARDIATGLRWMRSSLPASPYAEAEAACLREGMSMPTLRELASTLDDARTAPAFNTEVFGEEAGAMLWTRTLTTAPGERWIIETNEGRSQARSESETARARCVLR